MKKGTLRSIVPQLLKATALATLSVHLVAAIVLAPFLWSLRYWTPPVTSLMVYRAVWDGYKVQPIRPVPLRKLPAWVPKLFIYLEDGRFYQHHGIDLEAIKTAYQRNQALGRVAFGGSTITQQLSRTLFLTPHKNLFRKYLEAWIALELDALVPKDRILELYVNLIEWGPGVFGIGNAARVYYRAKPEQLSAEQFCRLAAVLPNPLAYTVRTLEQSRGMLQRYQTLVKVFLGV